MAKKDEEVEIIKLNDKVTLYATDSAPYHNQHDEIRVHPKQAPTFLDNGWATEEPTDASVKKSSNKKPKKVVDADTEL